MRYYWALHQCLLQSYKLNHKLEVDPLVVMVVDLKCSRKAVGSLAMAGPAIATGPANN